MSQQLIDYGKRLDYNVSYIIYSYGCKHIKSRSYLKALEYSCHGIVWFSLTAILLYLVPHNKAFAHLLVGLILDVIYVAVIKALARRRRPNYARQDDQLMVISVDKHSFPSGHASRAIYIALFCSNRSLVWIMVWLWSLSVCVSRILLGRHHAFDVMAGAALGYAEYITQFTILAPINAILIWFISALLNTNFSD